MQSGGRGVGAGAPRSEGTRAARTRTAGAEGEAAGRRAVPVSDGAGHRSPGSAGSGGAWGMEGPSARGTNPVSRGRCSFQGLRALRHGRVCTGLRVCAPRRQLLPRPESLLGKRVRKCCRQGSLGRVYCRTGFPPTRKPESIPIFIFFPPSWDRKARFGRRGGTRLCTAPPAAAAGSWGGGAACAPARNHVGGRRGLCWPRRRARRSPGCCWRGSGGRHPLRQDTDAVHGSSPGCRRSIQMVADQASPKSGSF